MCVQELPDIHGSNHMPKWGFEANFTDSQIKAACKAQCKTGTFGLPLYFCACYQMKQ